MKKTFALLIAALWINIANAEEYSAKVIVVIDGDTLVVLHNGVKVKIRLANIDAPEKDQAFGMESRQAMVGLVFKKQVHIDSKATDKYGRTVAEVSVDGRNVNEEMVKRGMAWEYSYYKPGRAYMALQSEAQQAHRGLWAQRNPIAPWKWRKTHPPVKWGGKKTQNKPEALHFRKGNDFEAACGEKTHCSQMNSCEEAYFYFTHCGLKSLDKKKDGVPCKQLCEKKR